MTLHYITEALLLTAIIILLITIRKIRARHDMFLYCAGEAYERNSSNEKITTTFKELGINL